MSDEPLPPALANLIDRADSPPAEGRAEWGQGIIGELRNWQTKYPDQTFDALNRVAGAMIDGGDVRPADGYRAAITGSVTTGAKPPSLPRSMTGKDGGGNKPDPPGLTWVTDGWRDLYRQAATGEGAGGPHPGGSTGPKNPFRLPPGAGGPTDPPPPPGPPGGPNPAGGQPIFPGNPAGGNDAEAVRVLIDIRGGIRELIARAANGGGTGRPGSEPDDRSPAHKAAADLWGRFGGRLTNNRLGRIGKQFVADLPEPVKRAVSGRVKKLLGGGKPPKARRLARVLRSVAGPVRGTRGAERMAAGVAGRGASAAAYSGATAARAGAGLAAGGVEAAGAGVAAEGAGLAAAAGPIGITVGAVVAAGLAMREAGKAAVDFGYSMEQANRRVADVSPTQDAIWTRLDADRLGRDTAKGEKTSGTSQVLADSLNRMEETLAPLETTISNLSNLVAAVGVETVTELVRVLNVSIDVAKEMMPVVKRVLDRMEKTEGGDASFGGVLRKVYDRAEEEAQRQDRLQQAARDAHARANRR